MTHSYCCKAKLKPRFCTARVEIFQCARCGNYWANYPTAQDQRDAWETATVTPLFLDALKMRRKIQSRAILNNFRSVLASGRVLDYGCGQGTFFSFLVQNGIDAAGCDISSFSKGLNTSDPVSRFFPITDSWGLPDPFNFQIISMLDVLEHCSHPMDLISRFRSGGVSDFVVKVPLSGGPLFQLAKAAAYAGAHAVLEKLFLVGDISPHVSYFSFTGLVNIFDQCGYALKRSVRLAEIGRELPERVRGEKSMNKGIGKFFLAGVGRLFEFAAPHWSDTGVFHFSKR